MRISGRTCQGCLHFHTGFTFWWNIDLTLTCVRDIIMFTATFAEKKQNVEQLSGDILLTNTFL